MTSYNAYDRLYNNMKTGLTVVNDNGEYSLGDYMLMKAGKQKEIAALPVKNNDALKSKAITALFSYVNEKLEVKSTPHKDETIRSFPFRTTAAAFLSAILACTLVLTYGFTVINNKDVASTVTVETTEVTEVETEN